MRIHPNATKEIVEKELSYKLVGIFFKVQQKLGRFCRERQFGDVIENELKNQGIDYKREWAITVEDRKCNFADFLIEDKILIELKSKPFIEKDDYYQMKRYLESANKQLGLLVNFQQKYLQPKRILNPNFLKNSDEFVVSNRNKGFTLIELVVVFAVITILTGTVILYGNKNRGQIILFQERYKITNILGRAKALTLQFYNHGKLDCGYGVHFNSDGTYFIFKSVRNSSFESCDINTHSFKYDATRDIKDPQILKISDASFKLASGLKFIPPILNDVVFVAPYGHVAIVRGDLDIMDGDMVISDLSGDNKASIHINIYGQISTK